MRILLDECVPRRLRQELPGHDVRTVPEMGWSGKKNGELLQLMVGQNFEVVLTVDQSLRHQQNLQSAGVAAIVLVAVRLQKVPDANFLAKLWRKIMAKKAGSLPLDSWSVAIGATSEQVKIAWDDLLRRELAAVKGGKPTVSPLALRRANSAVQRKLAAHLAGFLLTENSFIVRHAGDPLGSPIILNTRVTVEHIANYFKEGWGVTDIQRDLPQLLREEIEAAIQYYLNHREEIERDMRHSQEIYAAHAPKQESMPT
jgi:uncharacterized protein (DUF433 family)